jgi:hypothetical protein
MTKLELQKQSRECFLSFIERLKNQTGYSEYRIMQNARKDQPGVPRNIITQIRKERKYISLQLCVLIGKSNGYDFVF